MRKTAISSLILVSIITFPSSAFAVGPAAGKAFNPDVSANFLPLFRRDTRASDLRTEPRHNGFLLQEAELQLTADVDVYFRAVAVFSVAQRDGSTEFGMSPEEAYADTISLPYVTLRLGKFKAAVGKHNQLHTHAFPFIDAPLINQELLGDEGFNEPGASAAVLIPLPWFMEFTVQGMGTNNNRLFNSAQSGDVAGVLALKNLWDLADSSTMELNVFGSRGPNATFSSSSVVGSDLTFKWRPTAGGKYKALIFQTEYLRGSLGNTAAPTLSGVASWLQFQFAERWWIQARTEYSGLPPRAADAGARHKHSALLGFFPSEFSGFRLQYDRVLPDGQPNGHAITLQANFSIGAHPAHAY